MKKKRRKMRKKISELVKIMTRLDKWMSPQMKLLLRRSMRN